MCSLNVWMHCRLLSSHTLTVWSELLETKCWLSGENATLRTHEAWPDRVPATFACCLQQVTHHICTNKTDLYLSVFHSQNMKARTHQSVQSKSTIHFRRQTVTVTHTTNIFRVHVLDILQSETPASLTQKINLLQIKFYDM